MSISILQLIVILLTVEQNVNGFSTFRPIVRSPRRPQQHSSSFVVAARRRRTDDDVTTTNVASENPRLSGRRNRNVGQKRRSWMENYEALLEYKRTHQHCRVLQYYSLDRTLGRWVETKRMYGKESLSSEQLRLLDKAGFDWEPQDERNNRLWQESYQKLIEFKEEHGDCCVPQKYESDRALGWWVCDQRRFRKQGILRADREEHLDAIGFTWSVRGGSKNKDTERVDRLWNQMYERLLEFRKKWGHCLVPKPFYEDPSLGLWVSKQRVLFKRGQLRPDRKKRLEEVEFEFAPSKSDKNLLDWHWDVMFQHLVDYKASHGDTKVKESHGEYGLGQWAGKQRRNKNVMDEQRRTQLDDIGFLWSGPRSKNTVSWQERFEEVREHSIVHGTCNVKRKENCVLATWVYTQRSRAKRRVLPLEKRKKLESIGFVF